MTKIGSPCEIALLGHSGSHAPQLMQSLAIIVAMKSVLLIQHRLSVELKLV
jgi:hypothetical protein